MEKYTNWEAQNIQNTVQEIFDIIDLNKNGNIEYSEFLLANLDWESKLTVDNLQAVFNQFDNVYIYIYIHIYIGE